MILLLGLLLLEFDFLNKRFLLDNQAIIRLIVETLEIKLLFKFLVLVHSDIKTILELFDSFLIQIWNYFTFMLFYLIHALFNLGNQFHLLYVELLNVLVLFAVYHLIIVNLILDPLQLNLSIQLIQLSIGTLLDVLILLLNYLQIVYRLVLQLLILEFERLNLRLPIINILLRLLFLFLELVFTPLHQLLKLKTVELFILVQNRIINLAFLIYLLQQLIHDMHFIILHHHSRLIRTHLLKHMLINLWLIRPHLLKHSSINQPTFTFYMSQLLLYLVVFY